MNRADLKQKGKITELSPAEHKVAALAIEGWSSKEIAEALSITEKTVKFHLSSIYRITGIPTRAKFIVNYYKNGDYYQPKPEEQNG